MAMLAAFSDCMVLIYPIPVNAATNAFLSGASIYIQTRKTQEERERDERAKSQKERKDEKLRRDVNFKCGVGEFRETDNVVRTRSDKGTHDI